jgi:ABC-type sugar transport system, periplasmic component
MAAMKKLGIALPLGVVLAAFLLAGFPAARGACAQETRIVGYLIGSPPAGLPDVMAALNRKLKVDLSAVAEVNYIGWAELNAKYPLVLAAGAEVDWIFTADWCHYGPQAVRGAFKELSLEQIKRCMPRHYAALPPEAWEQAKVDGKVYMIPTASPDRKVPLFLVRGDLRKKYGIAPIRKTSELGPYLAAIKNRESGMVPMRLDNGYDLAMPFDYIMNETVPSNTAGSTELSSNVTGSPFVVEYQNPARKVAYVLDPPYLAGFRRAALIMKDWYDRGYINKNPFANTVLSRDSFAQGLSGVGIANSVNVQDILAKAAEAGYEPEIVPALSSTGVSPADPYTNNAVAIAASCRNVEKTLRFLDLVMEDKAYNNLVYLGIEGKNYVLEKGKVALPAGLSAAGNRYPPDASGFWFVNKALIPPLASWSEAYIAHRAEAGRIVVPSTFSGFTFMPEKVKTEVANMANVWAQYANPIYVGAVPDVDAAIAALREKLAAADAGKVYAEMKAQASAFAVGRR